MLLETEIQRKRKEEKEEKKKDFYLLLELFKNHDENYMESYIKFHLKKISMILELI